MGFVYEIKLESWGGIYFNLKPKVSTYLKKRNNDKENYLDIINSIEKNPMDEDIKKSLIHEIKERQQVLFAMEAIIEELQ